MKLKQLIIFALVAAFAAPAAFAGGISIVGAGTMTSISATNVTDPTFKSKMGFGGGVLFDLGSGKVMFETGALYLMRKTEWTYSFAPTLPLTVGTTAVQVPVLARFKLGSAVSLGLGGFVESGMGKVKSEVAGISSESSYGDNNLSNLDYGALASLGFRFPMGGGGAFLIDGRYAMGLKNRNTNTASTATIKMSDFQALVGIQFGGK